MNYEEVRNEFVSTLNVEPIFVDVVFVTLVANQFQGDPLWVIIVAPAGYGKTEIIRSAIGMVEGEQTIMRESLTPRTLISHFKGGSDKDCSLLPKLRDKVLVIKDFSTLFSINTRDRQEVMSQLHGCYDGTYGKSSGMDDGRYDVKFGLLGASTDAIDFNDIFNKELGDRFLYFRPKLPADENAIDKILARIWSQSHYADKRRASLGAKSRKVIKERYKQPELDEGLGVVAIKIAKELAALRRHAERNSYSRQIRLGRVEFPSRIISQFKKAALGAEVLGIDAKNFIYRLAADSIPYTRRETLRQVASGVGSCKKLKLDMSLPLVQEITEELALLGVIRRKGNPTELSIRGSWTLVDYMVEGDDGI